MRPTIQGVKQRTLSPQPQSEAHGPDHSRTERSSLCESDTIERLLMGSALPWISQEPASGSDGEGRD
jgi:hypothetical protein